MDNFFGGCKTLQKQKGETTETAGKTIDVTY